MTTQDMMNELEKSLVAAGVPSKALLRERKIRCGDEGVFDADLIVVAEDSESIISVFEVKSSTLHAKEAARALRKAMDAVGGNFSCWAVANDGERVVATELNEKGEIAFEWIPLTPDVRMIENYTSASSVAIKAAHSVEMKMAASHKESVRKFNWITAIVGGLVVLSSAYRECYCGSQFSWKIYAMIAYFYSLFAVAYGYVVHLKCGVCEIRIEKGK